MRSPQLNPKFEAVNGLGELVDEAIQALQDCLASEDESVKLSAAKYVMDKLVTPKATHTYMSSLTTDLENSYAHQRRLSIDEIVKACSEGHCSIEEAQTMLDMSKSMVDLSKQQETLDQLARIRELESRRSKLITIQTDQQRFDEALA